VHRFQKILDTGYWIVLIRKLLSGVNLAPPNGLWFVILAKAGIQEWGFPDGYWIIKPI
jgi:hypothetical protein